MSAPNFDKLTAYLKSLETDFGVPGLDLKIMKDHEVVYRYFQGYSDYEKKCPMNGTELYDIYSASKVITMVAVMQLVEKGVLKLDDPVTKYIPAFADTKVAEGYELGKYPFVRPDDNGPMHSPEHPITLELLMSMTSGLSYDLDHPRFQKLLEETGGHATTLEIVNEIAKLPLLFEPGTRYNYSLGHDVMAAVVEVASGERFADYVQHHIFDPLGITDMYYHPGEAEKARMAAQWTIPVGPWMMKEDEYAKRIEPAPTGNRYRVSENYDSGGAGVTASVDAYATFVDALACGGVGANGARIITQASLDEMKKPRLDEQQLKDFGRFGIGYSYGLGVRTLANPAVSKSPIGEFGWDGAAGAFCMVDTDNHLSLYYGQEVLMMPQIYFKAHPMIRDLTYEALGL